MHNIIINEQLKTLLPPLSEEEYEGLEKSILKDGCISPLVLWNDILVDGHHRYEICTKHKVPYAVKSVVLENMDDAKLWAGRHQVNRRNLTDYHRAELTLKLKDVYSAQAKERQRGGQGGVLLPSTLTEAKETRQELAQRAGVSSGNLTKIEFIAEHADEETKEKLRRGEKGVTINSEYNRVKAENAAQAATKAKKTSSEKSGDKAAKKGGKPKETVTVKLKSSPKVKDQYSCGVKFEPDPDDDFFDWITEAERKELEEIRKTCPNRVVPQIHNFTIQNIPEHKPDQLLACLFSLFKVRYREKLAYGLLRKMFNEDGSELAADIVMTLYKEFQNQ